MKKNNKILELADLQHTLISTCNYLGRPIRKSQLIRMVTELFECNTPKQTEFALIDLIERGSLCQQGHFITTQEFASTWDGSVTAIDEAIVKFLLSLKEEAKHDLFFNVYAQDALTSHLFFQFVQMNYPVLLCRTGTALACMEYLEKTFSYGLNNDFYAELNDYPAGDRWLTSFFDNPDCRIFIKNMNVHKNHANIQVVLVAGKRRSYRKANADFDELVANLPHYFDKNMIVHIRKSLTTFSSNPKRKK